MDKFMKRTTIGSVMRGICYGFAALLFAASCANDDVAQDEKQKKDNIPAGTTVFTGTSLPDATTRTAILNHTKGAGASVNWSSTDKIWVKDDGGTWQQSGTVTIPSAANKAEGVFALSGTYTGTTHDVLYTNKSVSGMQPQVEIKKDQTQSAPNNFDHAGESGDCGIATGNKVGSNYKFTLNHKAAYLCFIPRTNNEYVKRSKLIKVEIMSDDDIAGTYDIAANGALTLASGGSKTITVTTGSGFDIDNSADDMSKNATYAVVAPGTHSFRIRYWLRNTTDNPDGPIEGTVSKLVTLNCTAGSIHDITANLDPHDYDGMYYMWDAKQNFWYEHEWNSANPWQPALSNHNNNNYPKSKTADPNRWYNDGSLGSSTPYGAQTSRFKVLPNVNEMVWYCMKGDPRFDANELWTSMKHLYKSGIWFLKKNKIASKNSKTTADMANEAPDGVDWRKTNANISNSTLTSGLPFAGKIGDYFFLPALGHFDSGLLKYLGFSSYYWSSSSCPPLGDAAYYMEIVGGFSGGYISVQAIGRASGNRIQLFE